MNCPLHNVEMEEKTGEWGPWYSHTIPDVGYCNGKKITPFKPKTESVGYTTNSAVNSQPVIKSSEAKPDWDAIAEGKVRHGVVVAVIEHGGLEALKGKQGTIDAVVKYIITGTSQITSEGS